MKIFLSFFFFLLFQRAFAQELFTYTEPASNMAAKSIGFRLNNTFMKEGVTNKLVYRLNPEIMFGISKKIMLHAEAFLSNTDNNFSANGAALYLKYRFYSRDEIHSHFRMAVFARASWNNSIIKQEAIDVSADNSGFDAGIIATKLINKIAISAGGGLLHATDNHKNKFPLSSGNRNAVAYNISFGKLLLPKDYVSYNQLNLNAMIELLGQTNFYSGKSFADVGTAIQFIIRSRMRIDIGYRFAIINELQQTFSNAVLLRLEYNIFNAYK